MSEHVKFEFDFNWKLTLCVVLIFPVLVKLSLWQIDRAEEKQQLLASWQVQRAQAPLLFNAAEDYREYQRVVVEGEFVPNYIWLRENQFYNGQLGYNVVMLMKMPVGAYLAVDRGWVEGSPLRDFVPEIDTPVGPQRITGSLLTPSDSKLIREAETKAKQWPHKILEIDLTVMGRQSERVLYNKVLKIDADSPAALTVYWRPINVSSAKHYGYAVQWGLLALALIILYAVASTNIAQYVRAKLVSR